jgi:predicted Rossmann fold flavoprotein
MDKRRVIVVGGGAAGLLAAGRAAQAGADTLLLERMDRPGRKLSITGKGRCNLTNKATIESFIEHFGDNGRFLHSAFAQFFNDDLISFLEAIGVRTVTERGGRVFPVSEDAQQVVRALVGWAKAQGVRILHEARVEALIVEDGQVTGVRLDKMPATGEQLKVWVGSRDRVYRAEAVVVATGGASYPATGSTGDGYRMAKAVGHNVVSIRPALVPLDTAGSVAAKLQGLSLRNVHVTVLIDGRKRAQEFGEMLFTHLGVSGPIILTLSGRVVDALREDKEVVLSIDLKPALDEIKLDARLLRDFDAHGRRHFRTLLKALLPQKLIPVCIDQVGIGADRRGSDITREERRRLRNWLKGFRLRVIGHRPIGAAIITAGGVSTKEMDPRTMGSRLVKGLYFAGEVLDIDADTGGYNLQAAFSTGWVAGRAAATGQS